jgi:membrane-bound lytic murein transglycosylase MltF
MIRAALAAPLLLLTIAGCAQPFEGRVADRLAQAGLSRRMADCMAERWVDRLSLLQLQKISDLADDLRKERGTLTAGRFILKVRELDDPEIGEVVTRSSVVCALSG